MGVASAIAYDKQREESLYLPGSQAYTNRQVTQTVQMNLRNCNLMLYNQNFNMIKHFVITRRTWISGAG